MSVSFLVARRARSAVHCTRLAAAALVGGLLVVLAADPLAAAVPAARLAPERPVDRVLVISIPHVGWADVESADVPHLKRLLRESAVANLTARSGGGGFASGYVTLGAGKRSKGTATNADGMGFGVDDDFGIGSAGDAFARRTGIDRRDGVVHLGIVGLRDVNEGEAGGSSVGALGTALRRAGYRTAVVGNADGGAPDDDLPAYRRDAVAGIMTDTGVVDAGRVDRDLLVADDEAPFGRWLDPEAVRDAFREVWEPRTAVLVEGSDLVRALAVRPTTVSAQDQRIYRAALERTDDLVGALLEEVDPERDAVVVVSPYSSRTTKGLTVVGVRAPGVPAATMTSSSTRRDGFVLLADVAPTVLRLVGVERPRSMNGRPFAIASTSGTPGARVEEFIDATDAALFRDRVLTPVTVATTVAAGLVAIAAVVAWEIRRRPWAAAARWGSSWLLGLIPAVYLARLVPFHDSGVAAYWAFLALLAAALALAFAVLGRRHPTGPTLVGLGVVVALLVVDLVTGAHLQLSTAFGYTPSIGVRFAGVGNVAYAFLGASALLLAGLLAHRIGGRRGAWVAVAVLGVALVADAAPFLGGDVGGALSLTPAYLATALVLLGTRLRRRTVGWLVGAAVVAVGLAAAADLARPARDRTHLGRLVTNARDRGWTEVVDVIGRKLSRNLDTWTSSAWRSMFVIGVLFVLYLAWRGRPQVAALLERVPELRASLVGFAILVVVGYALNDSGAAIPAVMLVVFVAAMVGLLHRLPAPAPDQPPATSRSTASVRVATPSH